uniref:dual-specificity kinase n=1 Tax=Acrobeloides nanus TaxID=290746 RepID=A0A914CFJ4_9BILA
MMLMSPVEPIGREITFLNKHKRTTAKDECTLEPCCMASIPSKVPPQPLHNNHRNYKNGTSSSSQHNNNHHHDQNIPSCSINNTPQQQQPTPTNNKHALIRGSSRDAVGCLKQMEDFEILERLGEGFFGSAYKVCDRTLSAIMVMKIAKIINPNSESSRLSAKRDVINEANMLQKLQHPNILSMRGMCVERQACNWRLHLLVDFCDSGSLHQLILNRHRDFPWIQRCLIALDVSKAMKFVHRKGYMHRDLTSMNVLLQFAQGRMFPKALVADFGLSAVIPRYPHVLQQVGTQNWMAPEMLMEKFYNEKADVFSYGIIMCQMIARIDADHDAGLYRTPMFGLDYVRFTARCPSDTPLGLLKLAFMCCLWNFESRPSFEIIESQLKSIFDNEIRNPDSEDIRLGRSHSDAAMRTVNICADLMNGKRHLDSHHHILDFNIPEGVSVESAMLRFLASHVASEDPKYKESEVNPFSTHFRYRSIRKMKPRDSFTKRRFINDETNDCADFSDQAHAELVSRRSRDLIQHHHMPSTSSATNGSPKIRRNRFLRRTVSLPSSIVFGNKSVNENSLLPSTSHSPHSSFLKKRSGNLGLSEQRELQGRITMTFRDYDREFISLRHPARRHTLMPGSSMCSNGPSSTNRSSRSLSQLRRQLAEELCIEKCATSPRSSFSGSQLSNLSQASYECASVFHDSSVTPETIPYEQVCDELKEHKLDSSSLTLPKIHTIVKANNHCDSQATHEGICERATSCISSKRN